MSRNGSGTYSLPAGNPVVTGTTISSSWANNTLSDIATALTQSIASDGQTTPTANLPMGGFRHTNVSNASTRASGSGNYASAADVQDGALTYLTSVAGINTITATAAASMTAYVAGQSFRFIPANTITAAATININSIGALSFRKRASGGLVALVAGDIIAACETEFFYDGTYAVLGSTRTYSHGADIASASTVNLDTATGDVVDITGTTTITAITLAEGEERTTRFTGVLTLTNSASLVLLSGSNITTSAGDYAIWRGYASGVVRLVSYSKSDGTPLVFAASSVQGDILYRDASGWTRLAAGTSGFFLKTQGAAANPVWAQAAGITLGTPTASTSGTSIDFTGIPSGVTRITVTFDGVSLSGTDAFLIQLGKSGGVENTGYKSGQFQYAGGSGGATTSTSGFIAGMSSGTGSAANTFHGSFIITRYNSSNSWVCQWCLGFQDGNTGACAGGGSKTLSGTLDRVRITVSGSNTFDAGTINIAYE